MFRISHTKSETQSITLLQYLKAVREEQEDKESMMVNEFFLEEQNNRCREELKGTMPSCIELLTPTIFRMELLQFFSCCFLLCPLILQIYNYQAVFNEDYNIANTPAPNDVPAGTPAVVAQNDVGEDDDDEPPLNENDDDDIDDVDQVEEQNTQHLVLAQFDKVTRTKSRWKCTLKDGIMHINNKDILFNKATGEFDF
nr:uncharacterized protein LOC112036112 [Quercus suber]